MAKDYYNILGVSRDASQDEVKKAYRKLAHQHHPDKKDGDESKFKEINEAYQSLGNAERRKKYDQFGSTSSHGGMPGGMSWEDVARAQGSGGPFGGGFQQGNVEYDMGDLGDMFGDLFGFGRRSGGRSASAQGVADIQTEMTVDFRDAVFGAEKLISLYKGIVCPHCSGNGAEPGTKIEMCTTCKGAGRIEQVQRTILGAFRSASVCPDCRGEGKRAEQKCRQCRGEGAVKDTEKIKVKIPAGISDGNTIRLSGKGEVGTHGSGVGDLFITIRVKPDPKFKRESDEIISEAEISFSQAALGTQIPVITLDGEVSLKVPAGTQSGKVFKLKEKGVPHLRSRGRGDHLVTVTIVTPAKLSRGQKKLLEELSDFD